MGIIYEPKGAAKEYCDLAANLYRGCGHGCDYCYAPAVLRKSGITRDDFINNPSPRKDVLHNLSKEVHKYKGREVQLCFTCDPYQQIDEHFDITRQAIQMMKDAGIIVRILTKGGLRSIRDFDLLTAKDWYGATLTFVDEKKSLEYEPFAAVPEERFECLKEAHSKGIQTWASLEPVIDIEQSLDIIKRTHKFVDMFKVGKLNHSEIDVDWGDFGRRAVDLLDSLGANYYIKKDLLKCME